MGRDVLTIEHARQAILHGIGSSLLTSMRLYEVAEYADCMFKLR
jgi:hypothetical protein